MKYIDRYVLPVPTKNLVTYRRLEQSGADMARSNSANALETHFETSIAYLIF